MDYKEIINIAQKFINCPLCGEPFVDSNINIEGTIANKYILQTKCENNHPQIRVMFIANQNNHNKISIDNTLSPDDMLDVNNYIQSSQGNFEKIFKK